MPIAFKTKTEAVYQSLRKRIIRGVLKPGDKLVISDLSKEFGCSDIPVREGIRRLQSEGLLNYTPHVGATISSINLHQMIEIIFVRMPLESAAAKLAIAHITDNDIRFLRAKNEEMKTAVSKGQLDKMNALNRAFHFKIYKAAPYAMLSDMITTLWDKAHLTKYPFGLFPARCEESIKEHDMIIESIVKKDTQLVAKLLTQQKINSLLTLLDYLENSGTKISDLNTIRQSMRELEELCR